MCGFNSNAYLDYYLIWANCDLCKQNDYATGFGNSQKGLGELRGGLSMLRYEA